MVGDATSLDITMMEAPFDIVLCQLVISVVGGVKERKVGIPTTPSSPRWSERGAYEGVAKTCFATWPRA